MRFIWVGSDFYRFGGKGALKWWLWYDGFDVVEDETFGEASFEGTKVFLCLGLIFVGCY